MQTGPQVGPPSETQTEETEETKDTQDTATETVNKTTLTKEYEFELTPEQVEERALKAADLNFEVQQLETEKKEVVSSFTSRIKTRAAERDTLLEEVRGHKELRQVECEVTKNFESNSIEYFFEGKLMESRAMTGDERQMDITDMMDNQADDVEKEDDEDPSMATGSRNVEGIHDEEAGAQA